jgi:hypothetical protein
MGIVKHGIDKFWPGESLLHHFYDRGTVQMAVVTTEMGIFVKATHFQGTGVITEYLDCLDYETGVFKLRQRKCDHHVGIIYVAWRDRQFPQGCKVRMKVSNGKPNIRTTGIPLRAISQSAARRLPQ